MVHSQACSHYLTPWLDLCIIAPSPLPGGPSPCFHCGCIQINNHDATMTTTWGPSQYCHCGCIQTNNHNATMTTTWGPSQYCHCGCIQTNNHNATMTTTWGPSQYCHCGCIQTNNHNDLTISTPWWPFPFCHCGCTQINNHDALTIAIYVGVCLPVPMVGLQPVPYKRVHHPCVSSPCAHRPTEGMRPTPFVGYIFLYLILTGNPKNVRPRVEKKLPSHHWLHGKVRQNVCLWWSPTELGTISSAIPTWAP